MGLSVDEPTKRKSCTPSTFVWFYTERDTYIEVLEKKKYSIQSFIKCNLLVEFRVNFIAAGVLKSAYAYLTTFYSFLIAE